MTLLSIRPESDAKRQRLLAVLKEAGSPLTNTEIRDRAGLDVTPSGVDHHLRALADLGLVREIKAGYGCNAWEWTGQEEVDRPVDTRIKLHTARLNYAKAMKARDRLPPLLELIKRQPMNRGDLARATGTPWRTVKDAMQILTSLGCVVRIRTARTGVGGSTARYEVTGKPLPPKPTFEEWYASRPQTPPVVRLRDPETEELECGCYLPTPEEIRRACEEIRSGWKLNGNPDGTIGPPRVFRLAMTRRRAC